MTHVVTHEFSAGTGSRVVTVFNPADGDLILITIHLQAGSVSSLSYGGVTPTLIVSAANNWPQTFIYGIKAEDQPAVGMNHDLVLSTDSATSGITFTKLAGVALNSLATNTVDNTTRSNNISLSLNVSAPSLLFGALTHRDGCPASLTSVGDVLTAACFRSPRGVSVAYRVEDDPGTYNLAWSWGQSNRRCVCIVALPVHKVLLDRHKHTAEHISLTHTSPVLGHDSKLAHYARQHFRVFDLSQAPHRQSLAIQFNFSGPSLLVLQGLDSATFSALVARNLSHTIAFDGFSYTQAPFIRVLYKPGYRYLALQEAPEAVMPLAFDFSDVARIRAFDGIHKHLATQLALLHKSTLSAFDGTSSHRVDSVWLRHTSPLVSVTARQRVWSSVPELAHRSFLAIYQALQRHTVGDVALYHASPLRGVTARHRQWVRRISFLPAGWKFSGHVMAGAWLRIAFAHDGVRKNHVRPDLRQAECLADKRYAKVIDSVRVLFVNHSDREVG